MQFISEVLVSEQVPQLLFFFCSALPRGVVTGRCCPIKATVINGKTFNDGDGFDVDKHYGKKVFAHRVVRPKADTIDFAAFRPLLTNLTAAINKHKAQPPGP